MNELMDTRLSGEGLQAFYPLMIVSGVVQILVPASVNIIMRQLGIGESLGGLLQVVYFVGLLSGTLLLTRLMQRWQVRKLAVSQALLLSVSLFASAAAPRFGLLLFFYLFAGFANGILITLPAVYATAVHGEESPRKQNVLYGFMSLGFVIGPILAGMITRMQWSWRWCFLIPAFATLPLAIPLVTTRLRRLPRPDKLSFRVLGEVMSFNRSLFTGLVLAFLLYAAAQASVNTWLVTFLEIEKGMVSGTAHLALVGIAISLTLGRWTCGFLSRKIEPFNILTFITIASGILVLAAPLPEAKAANVTLYMMLGFSYSGIYPFLIGYAAWFPESESSAVITAIISAGAMGGVFFPYLIGLLNEHINPILGMSSVVVFIIGVVLCEHWIRPHLVESSRIETGTPVGVEA